MSARKLNEKFAQSLFVEKINMEDVQAVIENNHAGNYELQTQLRYDNRSGNMIMRTQMTVKDDERDRMKLLRGDAAASPGTTHTAGPTALPPIRESGSTPADRKHSRQAAGSTDATTMIGPTTQPHTIHAILGGPATPLKPIVDHRKLLFPHVERLDGTIQAISHDVSFRYFGEQGRVAFFEHFRSMCGATTRIAPTLEQNADRHGMYSPNSSVLTYDHDLDDFSFAGGSSIAGRTVSTANTDQHPGSVASFKAMFQKDDASACSTVKVASVMGKLSQEYYTTFESMVSKEGVKRSIDREILSHNSFKRYQLRPYVKPKTNSDGSNALTLEPIVVTSGREMSEPEDEPAVSAAGVGAGPPGRDGAAAGRRRRLSHTSDRAGSARSRADSRTGSRVQSRAGSHRGGNSAVYERNLLTRGRVVETGYSSGHLPVEADALNAVTPASPRTKYLSGCIREGLHPMPNLIVRKQFSTAHNLAHYGFGDKMGCVLAECLPDLPHVEALNLADNNLTDASLKHLIRAIASIKTLRNLDLSRNKIDGESSDELAEYVSRADCPLVRLTLQSADVDDGEAERFVQCLCSNGNILELDLSNNLLGTAEASNGGDSAVQTGGVALAEFISSESCKLQVLKVSWNSIRLRSAVRLAEAVAFNHTLTHLDLSCNGMGHAAGEALGDAIMENRTLKTLLVANNNFTSTACLSMCVGVVENLAMKHLSLNDNPIGKAGASMVMQTAIILGSRVHLTAQGCNTSNADERCWYDPGMPCRDYELHLDQPFHRAVAFHLLQTVATHSTLIFADISYEAPGSGGRATKLKLVQSVSTDREKYFDEEQRHILKGLRLLLEAASNAALGTKLFYEADEDNSGRLDKDELQNVLDKIGFKIDSDRLQDILAVFDVDGAGTIDLTEFQSLLKSQHHEVAMRIKEMLQYPILALSTSPTVKYVPPRSGVLRCSVVDGFVRKKNFYMMTATDQKYAFAMAKGIGDVLMMTDAVRHSKMRMNEAYAMYKLMYKEVGDKAEVLVKVLPQMMYPHEARQLVSKVTNDDRVQLARLNAAFSVAVRPIFGAYNGYYCLDLSKELHRVCFARLLEQSQTVNAAKASRSIISYGRAGDTSQHGNWTSFRNEFRNGQPVQITAQLFTPMPQSGILEFDFSGGLRPNGSELRLTDRRLCKVLQNLCLLESERTRDVLRKLHDWKRRAAQKSQDGQLFMPMSRFSVEKALEVGQYSDLFYEYLPERRSIMHHARRKEGIKVNFMKMNTADTAEFAEEVQQLASELAAAAQGSVDSFASAAGSDTGTARVQESAKGENAPKAESGKGGDTASDQVDGGEATGEEDDEDAEEAVDTFDMGEDLDGQGEEEGGDEDCAAEDETAAATDAVKVQKAVIEALTNPAPAEDPAGPVPEDMQLHLRQKKIKETKHRLQTLLHAKRGVSKQAKASRFVEAIEEAFQQLWILARHLALIVTLFQDLFGDVAKTEYFGSYCADIVVLLYSRVVDLHNLELIWEVLSAQDCACVIARIGLLNLFNPLKPDVTMELDLRRREERVVAKMIVYLSVDEPGINLNYKRFQWKRDLDPIPGWDVTEPWFTEEGLPQHGKFAFTYYSGEGRNRNGCIPNIQLRKALIHLTLIDENEIVDEGEFLPDDLVCTAEQHFEENRKVWLEYLVPATDAAKRR